MLLHDRRLPGGAADRRHVAQKQLGELLGRKVTIERIRINPFALSVTIGDFRIYEPDQVTPFFGFSRLYVNAELSSVFRRAPVVKEIALDVAARSRRAHQSDRRGLGRLGAAYNFSDIVARLAAVPKAPEPPPRPTRRRRASRSTTSASAIWRSSSTICRRAVTTS